MRCHVHIFKFGKNTLRKDYQFMKLKSLACIRNYCESNELNLGRNYLIYEGSPIFCDEILIGYVSKGTLNRFSSIFIDSYRFL